jgi:hypothetical protein
LSEDRAALSLLPKSESTMVSGYSTRRSALIRERRFGLRPFSRSTMPGSDSEEDIDDVEFDNEGEEDIEQEIFDAIEAGAEDATDGDAVCCFQPPMQHTQNR